MSTFDAPPPPPPPAPRSTTGTSRSWIWILLVIALGSVCVCGLCGGGALFMLFRVVKSTDVYQVALQRVQHDPQVIARLGEPIVEGWMPSGNVNIVNGDGHADVRFSVSGPKGSAQVHVVGERSSGDWTLTKIVVTYGDETSEELPLR